MWTIYTFGNGDVLTQILLGIRIMMTTGRFESLMELALLVFAMFGLVYFVFNRRFLVPLVVGAFSFSLSVSESRSTCPWKTKSIPMCRIKL